MELLEVDIPNHSPDFSSAEEHPLRVFSRLSSLSVNFHFDQPNDSFFRVLREMHQLTLLRFKAADKRDHLVLAECLSVLTGLRSLTLFGCLPIDSHENDEEYLMTLTLLTQLTQLSLGIDRSDLCRRFPTGIQSLHISFSESPQADFVEILMTMTNLTSLSICTFPEALHLFRRYGATPSQFSQELRALKHLSIRNVVIDDLFLEALGLLTPLTSLFLESADPYLVCPRLSNLSELMELEISSPRTCVRNGEFPQLFLPKLRRLDLPLSGVDANVCEALLKTLPCLRKMALCGKTLDL